MEPQDIPEHPTLPTPQSDDKSTSERETIAPHPGEASSIVEPSMGIQEACSNQHTAAAQPSVDESATPDTDATKPEEKSTVLAPPARTIIFSRASSNAPSSNAAHQGWASGSDASPPSRVASAVSGSVAAANSVTIVAESAATGIANATVAAARVAIRAASAARAATTADPTARSEGALSISSASSGIGTATQVATEAATAAAALYSRADATLRGRFSADAPAAASAPSNSSDSSRVAARAAVHHEATERIPSGAGAADTTFSVPPSRASPGYHGTHAWYDSRSQAPSATGSAAAHSLNAPQRPSQPRLHAVDTRTASHTAGLAVHDVSEAIQELKQALLCQLRGMTMQLECLRKCDEVLALKCTAQAGAASALKTFSQDVVQASKKDYRIGGVDSKLKKLSVALQSIEDQLTLLEASENLQSVTLGTSADTSVTIFS